MMQVCTDNVPQAAQSRHTTRRVLGTHPRPTWPIEVRKLTDEASCAECTILRGTNVSLVEHRAGAEGLGSSVEDLVIAERDQVARA